MLLLQVRVQGGVAQVGLATAAGEVSVNIIIIIIREEIDTCCWGRFWSFSSACPSGSDPSVGCLLGLGPLESSVT